MIQKISELIGEFLAERVKSDSGFAPVGENDIERLYNIIELILDAKYERDADGDLPVVVRLVDWTKYEKPHFLSVKHSHGSIMKIEDKEWFEKLRTLSLNLSMAQEGLKTFIEVTALDIHFNKEK